MKAINTILLSSIVVLTTLLSSVVSSNTNQQQQGGIHVLVTNAGAQHVVNNLLPIVMKKITSFTIPDISDSTSVSVLGTIDYGLTNIRLNSINYGQVNVRVSPLMEGIISGVGVSLSADWSYKKSSWPHLPSGSGSADITISDASLTVMLTASVTNGKIQLHVTNINSNMDNLDVSIHGSSFSWLYDLIIKAAKGKIKDAASQAICDQLTKLIDDTADTLMASMSYTADVTSNMAVDFSFVTDPILTDQGLIAPLAGAFVDRSKPVDPALPVHGIPVTAPPATGMLGVAIDEYFLNSAFYTLHNLGGLEASIDKSNLPPGVPVQLNTATFQGALPAFYNAYPNADIRLDIKTAAPPVSYFTPAGGFVNATVLMTWSASQNNAWHEAFVVSSLIDAQVVAVADGLTIKGKIALTNFALSLQSSNIGNFDTTILGAFFNAIMSGPVIGLLNNKFAQGVSLPSFPGLVIDQSTLNYQNGYMDAVYSFHYNPPNL